MNLISQHHYWKTGYFYSLFTFVSIDMRSLKQEKQWTLLLVKLKISRAMILEYWTPGCSVQYPWVRVVGSWHSCKANTGDLIYLWETNWGAPMETWVWMVLLMPFKSQRQHLLPQCAFMSWASFIFLQLCGYLLFVPHYLQQIAVPCKQELLLLCCANWIWDECIWLAERAGGPVVK